MENFNSIEDQLSQMQHIDIIKQKFSAKKYIIGTVGGVILFILYFLHLIPVFSVNIIILLMGLIIITWSLIKLIHGFTKKKNEFIYEPTGKKLIKHLFYYDNQNIQKIHVLLEKREYAKIASVETVLTSGHLLKILSTDDGIIMFLQVLEYVPYDDIPTTEVLIIKGQESLPILKMIKAS